MTRHFQHKHSGNVYAVTSRHTPNPLLYTEVRVVPLGAEDASGALQTAADAIRETGLDLQRTGDPTAGGWLDASTFLTAEAALSRIAP